MRLISFTHSPTSHFLVPLGADRHPAVLRCHAGRRTAMPQRGCMESPGLGRPRSAPPCAGVLRARSLRQPQPTESDHLVSSHRRTPPPPPPHIYTHTAVTSPRTRASTATDSIRRPLPPAPTPGSARPRVSRSSTGAPPPSLTPPGDGGALVHSLGGRRPRPSRRSEALLDVRQTHGVQLLLVPGDGTKGAAREGA